MRCVSLRERLAVTTDGRCRGGHVADLENKDWEIQPGLWQQTPLMTGRGGWRTATLGALGLLSRLLHTDQSGLEVHKNTVRS